MAAKRFPVLVQLIDRASTSRRRGLSLLELVLALALSVVVLGLVSMALRLQLQTFEQRRDRIDQASLGRAILRHISDDLRCAIANRPIDLQGVSTVTGNATQALGGMTGATDPTSGGQGATTGQPASGAQGVPNTTSGSATSGGNTASSAGASGANGTDPTGSTPTAETTTGASSGQGAYVAGLYGDQYSVQFDMTRLPRLDEYSAIVSEFGPNPITQIPTDIRTVSYYLAGSTPMTQASAAMSRESGMMPLNNTQLDDASQPPQGQGLIRQERDRAVASYSQVSVDYSDWTTDTGEEVLAEEVTRLEFQYFDGYQWWPSWDSDDRGGLPVAIEIIVGFLDRKVSEEESANLLVSNIDDSDTGTSAPKELYYRLVVRIPTAEPLDPYAMEEEEAPAADPNAASADAATDADAAANTNNNGAAPMGASPMGAAPGAAPGGGAVPGGFGPGGGGPGRTKGGGQGGRGGRGGGGNAGGGRNGVGNPGGGGGTGGGGQGGGGRGGVGPGGGPGGGRGGGARGGGS